MTKYIKRWTYGIVWLYIFELVLSGCAMQPVSTASRNIPTRDFLLSSSPPYSGYGAFGYLLFTTQPNNDQQKLRYVAACNAFMTTLEPSSSYSASSNLMPTYWLLRSMPKHETCAELVQNYDYVRAKPLVNFAGMLSSSGPVLAAWDQLPENTALQPNHQLILDLSNFSDDDMQRALRIWAEQIARDPSLWQNGFDIVRIRESFRNLIQRYGDQIVQIITKQT